MEYEHIVHSFEPVYDKDSEILILGTLPSVKSRENNFYYGHKQNRFGHWHDSGKNERDTDLCKRKQGRAAL